MGTKLRYLLLPLAAILSLNFSIAQSTITGTLTYHNDWGMSGCTMYLMDPDYLTLDSCITDGNGQYIFNNVFPGDYYITGTTSMSPGGVDLADAYLLMMYLFNYYNFSPMQELAADVDGSGTVDWTDYFTIVNGWITMGYPFPAGDWVFDTTLVTVTGGRDNTSTGSQGSVTGDMNSSLEPDKLLNYQNIFYRELTETLNHTHELVYPVSISSGEQVIGFHLVLELPDNVEFIAYDADISIMSNQVDNVLKLTWMNEELQREFKQFDLELVFRIKGQDEDIEKFNILMNRKSHFVDNNGKVFHDLSIELANISVKAETGTIFTNEIKNYPNPFIARTTFSYSLRLPGEVDLYIFNHAGQLVSEFSEGFKDAGQHSVIPDLVDLPAGVYQYRIIYTGQGKEIQSGSMIKIR